jgi:hypothetical protein
MGMAMSEFDVEAFVAKMEGLGLNLTAVTLPDGRYRVNRWRTMNAVAHTLQIQNLWSAQIGSDPTRIEKLAAHLLQTTAARAPSHAQKGRR